MKFKFKIEDLGAIALLVLAAVILYAGMSHAQAGRRSGSIPTQQSKGSYHTMEDLPQIVTPAKPGKPRVPRKLPSGREPVKGQLFKIGIIDTGFDQSLTDVKMHLCPSGHYDFGANAPVVGTTFWHGTAVAQAIVNEFDESVNYCFVIYQVQGPLGITADNLSGALRRAAGEGLVAVNISLEGNTFSFAEKQAVKSLADKGTAIFIAAGNRHLSLDTACMSYPACYLLSNTYVVGATQDGVYVAAYSNYGSKVSVWKDGSIEFGGSVMQGTSFASPRACGDFVSSLAASAN